MGRKSPRTSPKMTDWGDLFHVEADSAGQRLYLIRLACGDGRRKPLSLREFATYVEAATGAVYDHKTISLLERDQQGWRLKDVETFASVDPRARGAAWLAFGVVGGSEETDTVDPSTDERLTDAGAAQLQADVDARASAPRKAEGQGK